MCQQRIKLYSIEPRHAQTPAKGRSVSPSDTYVDNQKYRANNRRPKAEPVEDIKNRLHSVGKQYT
ncbi:hypothetical protein PPGU19_071180 (plasmid) [Paraburkholderia sp. PGU19]|nr:hypothetical protein PPGU19_071180 [Paraburkholderia sp. PGU19]